jgi:hypothetical protein
VGTAVKEIIDLATQAASRAADPAKIIEVILLENRQSESQAEITKAIDKFGKDNPDLVANQYRGEREL